MGSNRLAVVLLCLTLACSWLTVRDVDGHRMYLRRIPNAVNVPCLPGADCFGGPCGAVGHVTCRGGPGTVPNLFGLAFGGYIPIYATPEQMGFARRLQEMNQKSLPDGEVVEEKGQSLLEERGEDYAHVHRKLGFPQLPQVIPPEFKVLGQPATYAFHQWTTGLCLADSDFDGLTNGDELGDPCCIWNPGDEPDYTYDISHPGGPTVRTSRPSCRFSKPKPLEVTTAVGKTAIKLSWDPKPRETCVCSLQITFKAKDSSFSRTIEVPRQAGSVYLRSLDPSSAYDISVISANFNVTAELADNSTTRVLTVNTRGKTNDVDRAAEIEEDFMVDVAGTHQIEMPFPYHAYAYGIYIILFFAGAITLNHLKDPYSPVRAFLHHHRVMNNIPNSFLLRIFLPQLWAVSWGQLLIVVGFLVTLGIWYYWSYMFFKDIPLGYGGAVPWARALGMTCFMPLSLILLPVTKYSFFVRTTGISYERALVLHRGLGTVFGLMALVHGGTMIVTFTTMTNIGFKIFTTWQMFEQSGMAGFITFFLLIVLVTGSMPLVRRLMFSVFYYSHLLTSYAVVVMSLLHNRKNNYLLMMMIPSIVLLLVDWILVGLDLLTRPAKIVDCKALGGGREGNFVRLIIKKKNFEFKGGDYIFIVVPSISLVPHPFSIVSVPERAVNVSLHKHRGPIARIFGAYLPKLRRRRETGAETASPQMVVPKGTPNNTSPSGADYYMDECRNAEPERRAFSINPIGPPDFMELANNSNGEGDDMEPIKKPGTVMQARGAPTMSPQHDDMKLSAKRNKEKKKGDSCEFTILMKESSRNNFTAKMYLLARSGMLKDKQIYVSGPYGNPSLQLHRYDLVLFMGAGIGVTPMLSLFADRAGADQKLILCWATASSSMALEFQETLKSTVDLYTIYRKEVQIFFTGRDPEDIREMLKMPAPLQVFIGRPDIPALVQEYAIQLASSRPDRMSSIALVTSGPDLWVSQAQQAVHGLRLQKVVVHLHCESFVL